MKTTYVSVERTRFTAVTATLLLCGMFSFISVARVFADTSLSVTVTPPLIQITIGPGESWSSMIKVVNNNDYDVTYYTQVVDMQANGEDGRSKFIPLINQVQDPTFQSFALARWIHLSPEPVLIKAGSSGDVPFTVVVPDNAEPGGHYAAILVGTQPGTFAQQGSLMKVSSFVSSLIFLRIKGDIVESGRIREFTSEKRLYQTPQADFTLRFENTGNTHLKPGGDVTIYNTWGKERGKILINQDANFGNVLPQSIRRFQFSWEGEQNVFDIGPYSAVVTLSYGEDGKKNVSATTYFWVVPLVPVSLGIGTLICFLLLITWFIRRYIRRALMLEQVRRGIDPSVPLTHRHIPVVETLLEPVRAGVIDLRSVQGKKEISESVDSIATAGIPTGNTSYPKGRMSFQETLTVYQLVLKYRLFIVFLMVCGIAVVGGWWYFAKVLEPQRSFHIRSVTTQNE